MPMNAVHRRLCRSGRWASRVEGQLLPWVLHGIKLGRDVLVIQPGYGVTTRALVDRALRLTIVGRGSHLAGALDAELGDHVRVLHGDGAHRPVPGSSSDREG